MVPVWGLRRFAAVEWLIMRRAIAIAVAGASLAGCSSFSFDSFKSAPPPIQVQLESVPPGADATTSAGPGCKTPCSVAIAAPEAGFSVTFAMPKFEPVTVPVQVTRTPGDFTTPATTTIDPNPVAAELKPAGPPPRPAKKPMRPKKPKATPAAASPFPNPPSAPPPPPPPPPAR
jgi:hypothetical protein